MSFYLMLEKSYINDAHFEQQALDKILYSWIKAYQQFSYLSLKKLIQAIQQKEI